MKVTDDLGRKLDLPDPPRRIVSLVPSVTETLAAFGLGERIVGVTDWCTEPSDIVARAARVGHVVAPDVARIAALSPDLVLANAEENRRHAVEKLEAAGLPVYVMFPRSVQGTIDTMEAMARLTGSEEAAGPMITDARAAQAEGRALSARHAPVPFFVAVWKDPWMTANDDTYLADLLRVAGGKNVFGEEAVRYPRTHIGEIAARKPALALLPTEPYAFTQADRAALIDELPESEILRVDGMLLAWHGVRTASALRMFARLFAGIPETALVKGA